ncbi:MAG: tRNA (N6-threonylcarbamoyladenosine(37)-N6)-methyltransferase TrmO [Lachnospiraceae bacterium]|nr:tRNA (N6-threonylcarbamoyladenosine(37)-N6)-methyltransferase TrmO [Lachnospiraceae bacterium]MBP5263909.1 tRNA (N6-threonylcarbamoyladenosine(37)-N6)-methyltransferase TrmO [Lachnospiraceae bacterium]MBP5669805.1 tRNA (N6-threonylcarbamoyladenosine(37)-N6)-methyltransferase TrmO [Lachnospiraceae bacterium]
MEEGRTLKVIARIHTDFPTKFGIPRQSGLVEELVGEITFEPTYRQPEALMGLEEYSHLWLLWDFSQVQREGWTATVHPPRLGGKEKRGVFATRSPFRPNPIGLSCVKLLKVITEGEDAPKLLVAGADLMDGTPIYDIKPYLPYADCIVDARGGFGEAHKKDQIQVDFPEELLERIPEDKREAAMAVLSQDPRAAYHKQEDYVYGMSFAGRDLRFTVADEVLKVVDVVPMGTENVK